MTTESFGWKTTPSFFGPRGIVARPERSASGNIVLRCGNDLVGGGWQQSVHVVLTPEEAAEFIAALQEQMA